MEHEKPRIGFVPLSWSFSELRASVASLEAMGADSLWAPGHVAIGREVPEAVTGLAALAALTERVVVGTSVLLAPLYHPLIFAKQAAQLDRLTGGRVAVGIGVGGEYDAEFRGCQVDLSERGPRTDEAIDAMRALWSGREVSNAGRFWPFEAVSIAPPPVQTGGPPIIVAGRKGRAMRRAAARGDGWMPFLYSAERYADSVAEINRLAEQAGRNLAGFQWMCYLYVRLDDDPDRARQDAASFIGAHQAGEGSRFSAVIDRIAVAGTVPEVTTGLQSFLNAGAQHLVIVPCERADFAGAARRIMEEVVPDLEVPDADRRHSRLQRLELAEPHRAGSRRAED